MIKIFDYDNWLATNTKEEQYDKHNKRFVQCYDMFDSPIYDDTMIYWVENGYVSEDNIYKWFQKHPDLVADAMYEYYNQTVPRATLNDIVDIKCMMPEFIDALNLEPVMYQDLN